MGEERSNVVNTSVMSGIRTNTLITQPPELSSGALYLSVMTRHNRARTGCTVQLNEMGQKNTASPTDLSRHSPLRSLTPVINAPYLGQHEQPSEGEAFLILWSVSPRDATIVKMRWLIHALTFQRIAVTHTYTRETTPIPCESKEAF